MDVKGKCNLVKFKEKMKKEFKSELSDEQLEGIFYDFDLSSDGIIDANELGQKLSKIYGPFVINDDKLLWDKISKNVFIDTEKFREFLESLKNKEEVLKKINLEDNPNITFWQFLRSKNKIERLLIEEIINTKREEEKEENKIMFSSLHQNQNYNTNPTYVQNTKNFKKKPLKL